MPFDGLFIHSLVNELSSEIVGGRVNKINQPNSFEVILTVRNNRKNINLLININSSSPRVYLTNQKFQNPKTAEKFVTILRKYLENSSINEVLQFNNDRIIEFIFSTKDNLGDSSKTSLIFEAITGKTNLFLLDKNRQIIASLKYQSIDGSDKRTLVNRSLYSFPLSNSEINPFQYLLKEKNIPLDKQLQGFGKKSKKELNDFIQSGGNALEWIEKFNHPNPTLSSIDNQSEYSAIPFKTFGKVINNYNSLSELLDNFFAKQATQERSKIKAKSMLQTVNRILKRDKKKMSILHSELEQTQEKDNYKFFGDLITSTLSKIPNHVSEVFLNDFSDPNKTITVPLDNKLTNIQNAQNYYKKSQKLKKAIPIIERQMNQTSEEILYLEGVLENIEISDLQALDEIQQELINEKYIRKSKKNVSRSDFKHSKPYLFISDDGSKIEVGKNNLQNDELSIRNSKKDEYWLHVKNLPGSHVVIHNSNPSESTIQFAAELAAYFSKANGASKIPVDLVQIKKLKKPSGSKPGFVTFEGQETFYVSSDEQRILEQLSRQ